MSDLRRVVFTFMLLGLVVVLVGCSGEASEGKGKIVLADGGWESHKFYNEVATIILEQGLDYEVETVTGSSAAIMMALEDGSMDAHVEMWTENAGEIYTDGIDAGYYVKLTTNFADNFQGLYVPTYVIEGDPERGIEPMAPDLKYMSDLADYWELFRDPEDYDKGLIIGSISGWTVDEILRAGVEDYGLDEYYNYISPGSESTINISLADAYEKGEPWLGYNWEPNWVMAKYDMTPIIEEVDDGPLASIGAQEVNVVANDQFVEREPVAADFLSNIETSSEVANQALMYIQEEDATAYEAAVKFLQEEEALWTEWIHEAAVERVKKYINE